MNELVGNLTDDTASITGNIEENTSFDSSLGAITKGDKGDKGDIGPAGANAYAIAKKNGFIGTESEWLASLHADSFFSYDSLYEFPNIGKFGVIYIDTGSNKTYRWDSENRKYFCVGSDYSDIGVINGGKA
ncbi:hypothetical protein NXG27_04010 [Megasphaera paucivorans]|uniref:Collagen triple helix repeat-containing protein n=1 Tax=Megasphaera paucivorans TaxID=349095 RepID=A0A1G9QWI4_9FIRM|nr:hypothetical protein [Megasphaera paucivorans]SDM15369.1 hypothetical protein SAMN05660299_00310 [Megasphaera paucivorans]